jgi:stage II sporulation protein AA (anti-sigma F factor antagonist)
MEQRIAVHGELDLAVAPSLLRRLDDALAADPGIRLEVDFAGVTFIDSTGLGVLVACRKRAMAAGGELTVANVAPGPRRVFEVTGLDKVLFRPCTV